MNILCLLMTNMPLPSVPGGPTLIDVDIVLRKRGARPSRKFVALKNLSQVSSRTKEPKASSPRIGETA
jgi:hypothetical protein